jgi:hypothetical protein
MLRRGWIVLTGARDGDVLTLTPPLEIDTLLLDAFAAALAQVLLTPDPLPRENLAAERAS